MSELKVNNPIDTDPDPSPKPGARRLRHYWTRGAGAAKIRWGVSGDFNRCVRHLRKYVSDPKGLCNVYHRAALGAPPGHGHPGGKALTWEMEYKRDVSSDERERLGKRGHAFKNSKGEWSYPIANAGDLANAIKAFGRAAPEDRERLKKYIQRRARELGKTDMVPDGWHKKSIEDEITLIETLSYAQTLLKLDVSEFTKIFADYDDEEETKDDMQDLEHKNISVSSSGVTETTEDGIVEALVSVTGIVDNVGDIIKPGAYEKTLRSRKAKGVWSHDWNTPVSRVEEIKELLPGDERLPKTLANGEPWPAEAGALYVKAKFNLETQRGREAFSDVKFFDEDTEWSIGYKVAKNGAEKDDKTGIRTITELDLYEFSPVLFGAASNARSLVGAAKSLFDSEEDFINEIKDVIGKDIEITEKKCETCDHDGESVEEVPSEEVVENIKVDDVDTEARSQEELLPITAESLSQIKALHDQLGEVLALLTGAETKDNKSLRGAMDALIDGAFDSGVVQDIDDQIIALEGAIKSMDSASMQQHANEALDQIQYALQDERATDQDITDLKNLAEAIGKAVETYQSTEPEETVDEPAPVEEQEAPKKITMTDVEWKAFLADI